MAGRGRAPKIERVNKSDVPTRGEVKSATTAGWSGEVPPVPDGLMPASEVAWAIWFGAWFAAWWTPSDLPGLRQMIRLYDQVERGEFQRASELRLQMDTYGVTPKGQQDRRWKAPAADAVSRPTGKPPKAGSYSHLKVV